MPSWLELDSEAAPSCFNFFLGFKKYKARKISRQERLKEMVVGNFLNILTVSAIILMAVVLTIGVSNHIRYKKGN